MMRAFLLALSLLVAVPLADAGAEPRVERRYYEVHARNAQELATALARSPLGAAALTELARTNIRWQPRQAGGGYVIASIQLDERIIQTFPRWVNRSSAPACLQREWDKAMAALVRHEDNHRRRYAEYLAEFKRRALAIPPQRSQTALFNALARLNSRMEAEVVAWHQNYDRRTQNGRQEGVVIRAC